MLHDLNNIYEIITIYAQEPPVKVFCAVVNPLRHDRN